MNITKEQYRSIFEEYKDKVDKYVEKDFREINFQNRVIIPLLEDIFKINSIIDIVDVSTQYKNKDSYIHTRDSYAGEIYTPDILIAKNWNYNNISDQSIEYLAVIEIKSPVLDPISRNKTHTKNEIDDYLNVIKKVILTDCYEWRFYKNNQKPSIFVVYDEKGWNYEEFYKLIIGIQEFIK